jgi:hypothetical protein
MYWLAVLGRKGNLDPDVGPRLVNGASENRSINRVVYVYLFNESLAQ